MPCGIICATTSTASCWTTRTLVSPRSSIRLSRLPTPGPCTSTARKSWPGIASAIAAVVSPIPNPISRILGALRPKARSKSSGFAASRQSIIASALGHSLPAWIGEFSLCGSRSLGAGVFEAQRCGVLPFRDRVGPGRARRPDELLADTLTRHAPDRDLIGASSLADVRGDEVLAIGRELRLGGQIDPPVGRSLEQREDRVVAGSGVDEDRVDTVEIIPEAVRAAVDDVVAVGEICAPRRIKRDRQHVALASGETGQALELHGFDQPSAMRGILGLRADFRELGIRHGRTEREHGCAAGGYGERAQGAHLSR